MGATEAERAWAAVLRLHAHLVPRLDAEMKAKTGLPLAWYDVLLEVHSAGGRLRMSDLGDRVVLSRSQVSRIVDELERGGLLRRERNSEDGRSSYAVLTTEGRRRFARGAKSYRDSLEREIADRVDGSALRHASDTLESLLSSGESDSRS